MVAVGDPIGIGLVRSLARPGGNATGLTSITPDLEGKRLELIREMLPTCPGSRCSGIRPTPTSFETRKR